MSKSSDDQAFLELSLSLNSEQLGKDLDKISDKISGALAKSLNTAVSGFGKKLGESIQVSFNDTVLGKLNRPITIKLDTRDAQKRVNDLVKPLRDVNAAIKEAVNATSKDSDTKNKPNLQEQKDLRVNARDSLAQVKKKIGLLPDDLRKQFESQIDPINAAILKIGFPSEKKLFNATQIKQINDLIQELDKVENKLDNINQVKKQRKSILGDDVLVKLKKDLSDATELVKDEFLKISALDPKISIVDVNEIKDIKAAEREIENLRHQIELLADTDETNIDKISKIINKITGLRADISTRINTVATNRNEIINEAALSSTDALNAKVSKNQERLYQKATVAAEKLTQAEKEKQDVAPSWKARFEQVLLIR